MPLKRVFLGGTCGDNHWREENVIPLLMDHGVAPEQLFNPVVQHWDQAAQQREDEAKRTYDYLLYVIASPDPHKPTANVSAYSLVELIMSLYDAPQRTVALIETTGMSSHTAKAMHKALSDLRERFPHAPIFSTCNCPGLDDAVKWKGEVVEAVRNIWQRDRYTTKSLSKKPYGW